MTNKEKEKIKKTLLSSTYGMCVNDVCEEISYNQKKKTITKEFIERLKKQCERDLSNSHMLASVSRYKGMIDILNVILAQFEYLESR